MANDRELQKLLAKNRIPPRVLRQDTPGGTVWVPRWRWAGRLFGREVPVPATVGSSRLRQEAPPVPTAPEQVAEAVEAAPTVAAAKGPDRPRAKERWSAWAFPLLAILAVLVLAYGLGTTYGYLLAIGHPPPWLSSGVLGAFLFAPSGALLLLLGGFACLVLAREEEEVRVAWLVAGIGLILLFLVATFASLL